jgi:hypothetical protein
MATTKFRFKVAVNKATTKPLFQISAFAFGLVFLLLNSNIKALNY